MVVATVDRSEPSTQTLEARLRSAIAHAAHLLPAQGPITVFIHHNTLHAFEDQPFEAAVKHGAKLFGCEPFLSEERYREALARGRIRPTDLQLVLEDELGLGAVEEIARLATRIDLRLALLEYPHPHGTAAELDWFLAEEEGLRRVRPEASAAARVKLLSETRRWVMRDLRGGTNRPEWAAELLTRFHEKEIELWSASAWEAFTLEALWHVCCDGVRSVVEPPPPKPAPVRHRDMLLQVHGVDVDVPVNDLLTRFCAAFLDQGISHWPLPDRERGFFASFTALYSRPAAPPDRWLRELPVELQRLRTMGPIAAIRDSLDKLGVEEREWDEFLSATLLALRGWAGMIHQIEVRGDRVANPIQPDSLIDFLAVRLLLDRLAIEDAARTIVGYIDSAKIFRRDLASRLPPARPPEVSIRAFPIFQLAQVFGWPANELARRSKDEWASLLREIAAFDSTERRRVFHLAYERRFRDQCLDAFALHTRRGPTARPRFQAITCLDEREESFRRHLEEVAPDCETFGAAGFFAVPMYFRGATDAHFVPLCPIVMQPKHWVEEQVEEDLEASHRRLRQTHRMLGRVSHRAHVGSRTFALGALLTATLGVLASIPLVLRILFPRLAARVRGHLGRFVQTHERTRLRLERSSPEPGPENGNLGFNLEEMAASGECLLNDIGLTKTFARLVFVMGHGSNSLNNPHKSAYDCGACGGSPGAPNGRALAQILNDPRIRKALARRGLSIPDDTHFVGGFHNTCDDSVSFFDLDRLPDSHRAELEAAWKDIDQTCDRNAHERCRRFMSAPLTLTPAEARRHVQARSEDLAQTRPELGHATNAICYVGRRCRTRGVFFDRRNFLTSYDPTIDDANGTILGRTMAAVFPVCGGINLEYFFSHVDSPGYGCGTKLPHNITSLLGVMDGAASDLRTGLPWQMVEIHEPVRLLILCETTVETMRKVLERDPLGRTLTENGWVQLAVQSPETNEIRVYEAGEFRLYRPRSTHLPRAASSVDWYRGWRDHLEFAEIC